jgi:hypothetical protein
MAEALATIVEECSKGSNKHTSINPPNTECGTVSAKKRGRPFKILEPTDYVPKPRGRPKKTKEEIKQYYKDYYEANKERITQKRLEYKNTPNYRLLRHEQNQRYTQKKAQKPKICLIDLNALEVN